MCKDIGPTAEAPDRMGSAVSIHAMQQKERVSAMGELIRLSDLLREELPEGEPRHQRREERGQQQGDRRSTAGVRTGRRRGRRGLHHHRVLRPRLPRPGLRAPMGAGVVTAGRIALSTSGREPGAETTDDALQDVSSGDRFRTGRGQRKTGI